MPLVLEDGTGLSNANSFGSVSGADAYHSERGDTVWAASTKKEANLINATDYLVMSFKDMFEGIQLTATQRLPFPRSYVPNRNVLGEFHVLAYMPPEIEEATYILARFAETTSFITSSADKQPQVIEKKTGPLGKKYAPIDRTASSQLFPYPHVRQLIQGLLTSRGAFLNTRRV